MNDLISRQDAIAVADYSDYAGLSVDDVKKVTDEVVKGLRRLPSAQQWIPCSERLPKDGRPVLIYAWNVHYVIARYGSFRTENGYKNTWVTADAWNGNTEIRHEVIAWMPLPEPWKGETDEQIH